MHKFATVAALAAALTTPVAGHAAVLFDSLAVNKTTFRSGLPAGGGTGQIIVFNSATAITSFGFLMTATAGTKIKFFIKPARTGSFYLQEVTLARDYTSEIISTPDFAATVLKDVQYTFGFITNTGVLFQADTDGFAVSQNGITEIPRSNPNYVDYAKILYDRDGLAEIGLQISGVGGAAAVPEPATWALLLTGFGLTGAAVRRRTRQAVAA